MNLAFETKHAITQLKNNIGHTAMCVVIVGLVIGISWTAFSLYYYMLLRPAPFTDIDRWYGIVISEQGREAGEINNTIDVHTYQKIAAEVKEFEVMGGIVPSSKTLRIADTAMQVNAAEITPRLFGATGIAPMPGRGFSADDSGDAIQPPVIISHSLWNTYFNGEEEQLGRAIYINGLSYTVAGVMPEYTHIIAPFDVYLPLTLDTITASRQLDTPILAFGKLAPTADLSAVGAQIERLAAEATRLYPEVFAEHRALWLEPLQQFINAPNETASIIFSTFGIAAAVITLLGCVNVANLLVARTLERTQEYSLRSAVGSTFGGIVVRSLIDSFVICLLGTALGVVLSYLGAAYLLYMGQQSFLGLDSVLPQSLDPVTTSIDFYLLIGLFVSVWLLSSVLPVWLVTKQEPAMVLAGATKGSGQNPRFLFSRIVVSVQTICSCFLLVVCGVLIYAMSQFISNDYGFDSKNYWTARVNLPDTKFSTQQRLRYMESLRDELSARNEFTAAGFTTHLPGMSTRRTTVAVSDRGTNTGAQAPWLPIAGIDREYLPALNVNIIEGRNFDANDGAESLPVAILDERAARFLWPNESPLGKRIQIGANNNGPWLTVVGVSQHVVADWPAAFSRSLIYQPLSQANFQQLQLVVKISNDGVEALPLLRDIASKTDRDTALHRVMSMDEHLYVLGAGAAMFSDMFLTIALATLALAVTGIYGVVSSSVLQRVTEIGVRRALGSSSLTILWLYLRRALGQVLIGCVLGGIFSILAGQAIANFLSSDSAALPLIYLFVCLGLTLFVAIATFFPVRKAIHLEPGDALRYE